VWRGRVSLHLVRLSGGRQSRRCRSAEEPHQTLDVLGRGCQEELLSNKPQSPQAEAAQSDQILQFREQGFHLLSLPLCIPELWRIGQLPCALSDRLMQMNGEIFISPTGALSFLQASPATFGAADVSVSTIANIQPNVVKLFPSRAAIAVALGQIGKSFRTVTGIVLSSALSRVRIYGVMPRSSNHCRNSPLP
jgi:hypothetical protein